MAAKKLAAVLGATRGQGGSIVNALLRSEQYLVRGVTATAASLVTPGADRLRRQGVELIEVNLDDPKTLSAAFASAQIIFAVTTMYNGDIQREMIQGRNIADAAAATPTLEHFVWSTLPSASTVSKGAIAVPHMDGKASVDEYILHTHPDLARKTTFYWGGFYAENVTYPPFQSSFVPSLERRVWIQAVKEDTVVPMVGDHNVNTGIIVKRILDNPHLSLPQTYVLGAVDWVKHGDLLRTWARLTIGRKELDHEATLEEQRRHQKEEEEEEEEEGGEEEEAPIYVTTDIDTVSQIWPGAGKELGQMLKFSEVYGIKAWSKDGLQPLLVQDLGLKCGNNEDDLVSTNDAIKKLAG